jgi:hypothetical protein
VSAEDRQAVRAANAAIGAWMFFSSFFWFHTSFQRVNAWVVGGCVVTAALAAARDKRWLRFVNALLGAWLIVSGLLPIGQRPPTVWNQVICGFFLVLFAVARSLRALRQHPGRL